MPAPTAANHVDFTGYPQTVCIHLIACSVDGKSYTLLACCNIFCACLDGLRGRHYPRCWINGRRYRPLSSGAPISIGLPLHVINSYICTVVRERPFLHKLRRRSQKWLLLAPSSRPVHRIKALPLVFALGWWRFNEAQVICRQRLFSEGVFASVIQKYGIFGLFWPLTCSDHGLRGNPFAHRAIRRSKIDPRSRPKHRRKAIFLL